MGSWMTRKEKLHCAQCASLAYQAMLYLALCRKMHFTLEQLEMVQKEQERIASRIKDMDDYYDIFSVIDELKQYDVELDKDDFERIFGKPL